MRDIKAIAFIDPVPNLSVDSASALRTCFTSSVSLRIRLEGGFVVMQGKGREVYVPTTRVAWMELAEAPEAPKPVLHPTAADMARMLVPTAPPGPLLQPSGEWQAGKKRGPGRPRKQ